MARRKQGRTSPPQPTIDGAWWALPAFLCAVFVLKLVVLSQLQDHPLLQPDGGLDAAEYVQLARRVIRGDLSLGPGLYYVSPLYIYFLAATLWVSDSFTFVRVVQLALGTAAVGCVFVSARAWFGERAAWFAAVLAALTGAFTFYEIVLFQSSLDTVLTSAALATLAVALAPGAPASRRGTSRLKAGATGILFGLQILNRPNIVVAVAGITLTLVVVRRFRAAAWLAAGVLLALTPVVARNAIVSHQFALASSQGGLNLYIGNHPAATGQYVAIPGVRANIAGQAEDTRRVAEKAVGRPLTDAEVSGYFRGQATTWIREHPMDAIGLFARKLVLVFNAKHQWLDFSYPYYAHDVGSSLWMLFAGPWLLVPLGIAGLVLAAPREQRGDYAAWASFVPFYAVGIAIFFVGERYRLPLFVPLCAGGGAATDRLLRIFRSPAATMTRRQAGLAGVLAVVACVAAWWPFDVPDGRFEERLRLSKVLMNRRDYGGAATELERAHALRPQDTATEFNLGMAIVSSGRPQEGLAHIRHAVDAGVPIDGARYALASVMLSTGDRDGAVTLLRTFFPAETDSADSCFQVGVLALNAGAPRVAERYLQRALQLRPGWPQALDALSRIQR